MRRTRVDRQAARARGLDAEAFVAATLVREGWRILARNWRGGGGELDLVALRSGALRFVEVKLRETPEDEDAVVGGTQRRRLRGAAEAFLEGCDEPWKEACFLLARVWPEGTGGFAVRWTDDPFDG